MTQALLKKVSDMTAQIEAQKKALVETLKPEFKSLFTPFFDKYPQVTKIAYTQYTPYFNDGEECTFRVGDLKTCVTGIHDPEESHYNWQDGTFGSHFFNAGEGKDYWQEDREKYKAVFGEGWAQFGKDVNDLNSAFQSLPEDAMKSLFGDHVLVVITRDGVDVEEYDHE